MFGVHLGLKEEPRNRKQAPEAHEIQEFTSLLPRVPESDSLTQPKCEQKNLAHRLRIIGNMVAMMVKTWMRMMSWMLSDLDGLGLWQEHPPAGHHAVSNRGATP